MRTGLSSLAAIAKPSNQSRYELIVSNSTSIESRNSDSIEALKIIFQKQFKSKGRARIDDVLSGRTVAQKEDGKGGWTYFGKAAKEAAKAEELAVEAAE